MFYPGDAKLVDGANGTFLGRLDLHGDGAWKERHFEQRAAAVAAEHGGTHVILVSEDTRTVETGTTGGGVVSNCAAGAYSATCFATRLPSQVTTETRKTRTFAVFAVPFEQWPGLPAPLRPTLPGEPAPPAP